MSEQPQSSSKKTKVKKPFNDPKAHYESLVSLLKYGVTIVIGLITIAGVIVSIMTFSDGKQLREAMMTERAQLRADARELREELNEKEALMQTMMASMQKDVQEARREAIGEISVIKSEATQIARNEAKNRVEQVFTDNNFEQFVAQVAKDRIEPQIKTLVDNQIAQLDNNKFQKYINDLKGTDVIRASLAMAYFQTQISREWSESQIKEFVEIYRRGHLVDGVKNAMIAYLVYQRSPEITQLFLDEVETDKQYVMQVAWIYLCSKYGEQSIEYYERIVNTCSDPMNSYRTMLQTGAATNTTLLKKLLDSKRITDTLFAKYGTEQLDGNVRNSLSKEIEAAYGNTDYRNTYFFTKK